MSGVVGIFLLKPLNDLDSIARRMSTAIHHLGEESVHHFRYLKTTSNSALILVRKSEHRGVVVDSSSTHLHITINSPPSEEYLNDEKQWNLDSFNTLAIHIDSNGLRIFRSLDGKCGLYYCRMEDAIFFSSEKKSLWAIGQRNIDVLKPGHILAVYWDGREDIRHLEGFAKPAIDRNVDRFVAVHSLEKSLVASFRNLSATQRYAVLFSGGVDSALAALLTRENCAETLLITVVCGKGYDEKAAIKAAELLSLESIVLKIDSRVLWNALPDVIHSIETSDRMHVEIALPFFFAAQEAKQRGVCSMVSGQGPDELFAGYSKHEKLMKERGSEAVEDALWSEILVTHETNIQRDVRAIVAHGLDVFFPYLYPPFVRTAMSLPASLKVDPNRIPSRKIIFRELAEHLGLPSEISNAPKHATQYSSGASKLLSLAVLERVEGESEFTKREIPAVTQQALDIIATHLQIPVTRKISGIEVDLKPTRRVLERIKRLASSD
jgi:asparagine synthetase B (glutamine-hydrolysing)